MKIYTKRGDQGTTSLVSGERVDKDSNRLNAYGTLDELSSFLGYLHDSLTNSGDIFLTQQKDIIKIINNIMSIEAILASTNIHLDKLPSISNDDVSYLETCIDNIDQQLLPVFKFTLPCGHPLVSLSHICRTICRRAEREMVSVTKTDDVPLEVMAYVNRLSDYLYVLSRYISVKVNAQETIWDPHSV